jgi:CDP-diacylglycerol--glycerol-3-phosphate 3-phosphatidyltransferase
MVTFARLVTMPLVAWLLYGGKDAQWVALGLGVAIGCTDFIDGYLARKHGPTVLGGLMDPIADKVFIAVTYLPFTDLGWFPAWPIALLFVRELLVTALRTIYELRGVAMKTSYLAKTKTWTQMQAIGVVFLFIAIESRTTILALFGGGVALSAAAVGLWWLFRKKLWRGAAIMAASFAVLLALGFPEDRPIALTAVVITVVAVTWASGIDYVIIGVRQLRGRGEIGRGDVVRMIGAIALPCLLLTALMETTAPTWALTSILSVELAVGGLDNLIAHHRASAGAIAWSLRVLGAAALLGAALLASSKGYPAWAERAALAALAVSVIGATREFWRGSNYYLDARLREAAVGHGVLL